MTSIIFVHWAMNETRSLLARYSIISLLNSLNSPCEVIVVDNGENEEDSKFFLKLVQDKRITHYLRNADNLHFGHARNQAISFCNGEFIAIVDNDLHYMNNWLEASFEPLRAYPERKLIGSPIQYPTPKMVDKYDQGILNVYGKKYRLNMRAGSNCMVMKKEVFEEIGKFQLHRIAGSLFTDSLVRAGYLTAVTPENMVIDLGFRAGYNLSEAISVEKTLTDKTKFKL